MPGPSSSPFRPNTAGTVTIAVATSSAATALVGKGSDLIFTNAGPNTAFVEQGSSAITAAVATGFPVLAGVTMTLGRADGVTHVATICAAGTSATLYVSSGEGS